MPQRSNESPHEWQLQTIKMYLTLGGRTRAQSYWNLLYIVTQYTIRYSLARVIVEVEIAPSIHVEVTLSMKSPDVL